MWTTQIHIISDITGSPTGQYCFNERKKGLLTISPLSTFSTYIWSFRQTMCHLHALAPFSLFHTGMDFPLPGPQTPYLSLSTFKASPNASSSMKLSLNPHLALVLAESVAPNGLCLHFHYSIDPSGLQILCVICFLGKITSSFRTGLRLPTWGFPMPGNNNSLLQRVDVSANVFWILLKGLRKLKVLIFDNCSL